MLDGLPAYDTSFEAAGGFGLFYYPPTFIPIILAFGLLPATAATWAWTALLLAAFAGGVAAMPVERPDEVAGRAARGLLVAVPVRREAGAGGAAAVPRCSRWAGGAWTGRSCWA